ncbi:MAG TPA: hypothetical protein DGG94_10470 [Micromonosporaceae bacterium]|nr:hypothetical protein [Micromonosporaceae bacterium]HCU50206.1 hypothetical protein [Micromonosporaceae bacterium]
MGLRSDRRTRLISLAGAAVLVVLVATAAAVWISARPARFPIGGHDDPYGLNTGAQAGASASSGPTAIVSPWRGSSPSLLGTAGAAQTSAVFKTIAVLGLGGFDTEVTVSNPAGASWAVLLTMPEDKPVQNRSTDVVKMEQRGTSVTLTPVDPAAPTAVFMVRFPDLLALGKSITACTVDGRPCSAA